MPTDTATKLADFLAAYRSGDASCLPYLADWLEDHDDPRTAKVRGLVRWHLLTEAHAGTGGDDTDVWAARDRLYAATGLVGIRLWACLCARWLPLHDGRRVADLLTDARSVTALAVAELHWCGLASQEEAEQAAKEGYAASGELWEKWQVAARAAAAAAQVTARAADAAAQAAAARAADAAAAYAAARAADAATARADAAAAYAAAQAADAAAQAAAAQAADAATARAAAAAAAAAARAADAAAAYAAARAAADAAQAAAAAAAADAAAQAAAAARAADAAAAYAAAAQAAAARRKAHIWAASLASVLVGLLEN